MAGAVKPSVDDRRGGGVEVRRGGASRASHVMQEPRIRRAVHLTRLLGGITGIGGLGGVLPPELRSA